MISAAQATAEYEITALHEKMPNGELRFRLTPSDGNGYIRTVASAEGGWQNAHSHKSLRETYIVESGWIASAEKTGQCPKIRLHFPGDIFTTEPKVVHNIYMSPGSLIHTVKHGGKGAKDWDGDDIFTDVTKGLNEKVLIGDHRPQELDPRYSSYIDLYNNLDKLLWTIPGFLAIGATVIVGFLGSIIAKESPANIPPAIVSLVLLFSSVLFYLGYVSMTRLREHHNLVGGWLAKMEFDGYFAPRCVNVKRRWPMSAPTQFRIAYASLSVILLALAVLVILYPSVLTRLLSA